MPSALRRSPGTAPAAGAPRAPGDDQARVALGLPRVGRVVVDAVRVECDGAVAEQQGLVGKQLPREVGLRLRRASRARRPAQAGVPEHDPVLVLDDRGLGRGVGEDLVPQLHQGQATGRAFLRRGGQDLGDAAHRLAHPDVAQESRAPASQHQPPRPARQAVEERRVPVHAQRPLTGERCEERDVPATGQAVAAAPGKGVVIQCRRDPPHQRQRADVLGLGGGAHGVDSL
jgi:hypothetical protein